MRRFVEIAPITKQLQRYPAIGEKGFDLLADCVLRNDILLSWYPQR